MLKKKTIIILVISAVILMAVVFSIGAKAQTVETATAAKGDLKEYIALQGKVELDKREKVYASVPGIANQLLAKEGDRVAAGQILLSYDMKDLEFAINKAQSVYQAASFNATAVSKQAGTEQQQQASAALGQAQAAFDIAQKDFDYKKKNLENVEALFKSGAVSSQDVDDAGLALASAESTLQNAMQGLTEAEAHLDALKGGSYKDEIAAAAANAKAALTQLEELKNNKNRTLIASPFDGIVLSKYIEKGAAIHQGDPLFEVANPASAYIRVDVLVDDMAKVRIGQEAALKGDILEGKAIQGKVYYIAPKAETKISSLGVEQQRVEVRISFDNTKLQLRPGYEVDVDLVTQKKTDTVYVPDKAVFEMGGKYYVFVIEKGHLVLVEVRKGIENDNEIELISGIKENQIVVIDPESSLKPGSKVKIMN